MATTKWTVKANYVLEGSEVTATCVSHEMAVEIAEAHNKASRASVEIKIQFDKDLNEYQVQWIINGKLNIDKTYHTTDLADAKRTKKFIEDHR